MCGVAGIGPGWDCGRCGLDGPNGLLPHCRVSMIQSQCCESGVTCRPDRVRTADFLPEMTSVNQMVFPTIDDSFVITITETSFIITDLVS